MANQNFKNQKSVTQLKQEMLNELKKNEYKLTSILYGKNLTAMEAIEKVLEEKKQEQLKELKNSDLFGSLTIPEILTKMDEIKNKYKKHKETKKSLKIIKDEEKDEIPIPVKKERKRRNVLHNATNKINKKNLKAFNITKNEYEHVYCAVSQCAKNLYINSGLIYMNLNHINNITKCLNKKTGDFYTFEYTEEPKTIELRKKPKVKIPKIKVPKIKVPKVKKPKKEKIIKPKTSNLTRGRPLLTINTDIADIADSYDITLN